MSRGLQRRITFRLFGWRMLGAAVTCLVASATGATAKADDAITIAAIGDVPYVPQVAGRQIWPNPDFEALIADINDAEVDYTIHIGDIKAGGTLCEDAVYENMYSYFANHFESPLVYSPGDNEWTDCHRTSNGTYDPFERLNFLRATFFPDNKTLGQNRIAVNQGKGIYVENLAWRDKPAMFISIHQPGTNNNFGRTTGAFPDLDNSEYFARNAANMAFLDKYFHIAHKNPTVKVVVVASQANPFERYRQSAFAVSGYADFIDRLRAFVANNPDKQVLYIGGDSHTPRVDQPLTDLYPSQTQETPAGTRYPNFTRLEVYATEQAMTTWFEVTIDEDGNVGIGTRNVGDAIDDDGF